MAKPLPKDFNCPTEFTLTLLGGKWKTVILCYLTERDCRYSELRGLMRRLSDKMLTERLTDLVAAGLIEKSSRSGLYSLTARGRTLGELLHAIYDWGRVHADEFNVTVGEPLKELAARKQASSRS